MKQMLRRNTILLLLLILSPVLFLSACGGDKEEPLPLPDTTQNTPAPETSTFTFKNQFLSFEYGTEWRVSGSTDNSFVLTHKERPGDVLLSAQWIEVQATENEDLVKLYRDQLGLLATEVQKLEDIKIGNINAERYASVINRNDQESVVTMHVLFNSGNMAYLITFTAGPDDFVAYTASANQVINTMKIP